MAWRLECCGQLERRYCTQQAGAHAVLNNSTGSAQLAATNVPITLGILDLIGSNGTTITGVQGVGLTMQTSDSSAAQINVAGGATHEINLPLAFAGNGAVQRGQRVHAGDRQSVDRGRRRGRQRDRRGPA